MKPRIFPRTSCRKGKKPQSAPKAPRAQPASPKQNKSAAEKKLRKQLEGLDLAESFVKDILDRGVYSISSAAADQNACKLIIEMAGTSISEAVKAAKNELKNTLSEPYADVLAVTDSRHLRGGAIFGLLHYIPQEHHILL